MVGVPVSVLPRGLALPLLMNMFRVFPRVASGWRTFSSSPFVDNVCSRIARGEKGESPLGKLRPSVANCLPEGAWRRDAAAWINLCNACSSQAVRQ